MNSIATAFYFLIFLTVQQSADAINCYSCVMGTDGCGPSFSTKGSGVLTTTSNTSAVYCTKTVVTSNTNAVSRSYSSSGTCTEGSSLASGITYYQYCCTTDLCNEAAMVKISGIFTTIPIFIGLILIK